MGICDVRFMDDWVILASTRWKLRTIVRRVNQILTSLHVEQHPDKTFIGRVSRGVDFLGDHLTANGRSVSTTSVKTFTDRLARLYEHGADTLRIGQYIQRWRQWCVAGVSGDFYVC